MFTTVVFAADEVPPPVAQYVAPAVVAQDEAGIALLLLLPTNM